MANSTLTIDQVHDYFIQEYLPYICILCVVSTAGVVGNLLTVAFYFNKRPCSTHVFIVALAWVDFIVCITSYGIAADMSRTVLQTSEIFCKVLYTVSTWAVYASVSALWAISVDRYFKLCRPFGRQLTVKRVKVINFVIIIVTALLSCRILYTQRLIAIPVKIPGQELPDTVVGYACEETTDPSLSTFLLVFHSVEVLAFICACVTLIITYSKIIHTLVQHEKEFTHIIDKGGTDQNGVTNTTNTDQNTSSSSVDEINSDPTNYEESKVTVITVSARVISKMKHSDKQATKEQTEIKLAKYDEDDNSQAGIPEQNHSSHERRECLQGTVGQEIDVENNETKDHGNKSVSFVIKSEDRQNSDGFSSAYSTNKHGNSPIVRRRDTMKKSERKVTIMMFAVSLGFLCFFLPYMVMRMTATEWHDDTEQDIRVVNWVPFLLPICNSVVNPVLYFGLNRSYRQFAKQLVNKIVNKLLCKNKH